MAYEKNTWQSGDVVTSAKLNNIENGIASGGVLIVTVEESGQTLTLSKTWNEINEASFPIIVISTPFGAQFMYVSDISVSDGDYIVSCFYGGVEGTYNFVTDSADGYPSRSFV